MDRGGNYFLLNDDENIEMSRIQSVEPLQTNTRTMLRINCSKCSITLTYPEDAYCVSCHSCKTLTAVRPISSYLCLACSLNIFYPAEATSIKCRCGKIYNFPSNNKK